MMVIYNSLDRAGILVVRLAPFRDVDYHQLMRKNGRGITYCQWLVPGTFGFE
jgi:hypothetical protein